MGWRVHGMIDCKVLCTDEVHAWITVDFAKAPLPVPLFQPREATVTTRKTWIQLSQAAPLFYCYCSSTARLGQSFHRRSASATGENCQASEGATPSRPGAVASSAKDPIIYVRNASDLKGGPGPYSPRPNECLTPKNICSIIIWGSSSPAGICIRFASDQR